MPSVRFGKINKFPQDVFIVKHTQAHARSMAGGKRDDVGKVEHIWHLNIFILFQCVLFFRYTYIRGAHNFNSMMIAFTVYKILSILNILFSYLCINAVRHDK